MPRRLASLLVLVVVAGCSRKSERTIAPDPVDAGRDWISPADLVLAEDDGGASLVGKKVPMIALVGAEGPPRALTLGFVTVPLVDGVVPAARAMPATGHHQVRLGGTVLGTGRSARYAVDSVVIVPTSTTTTSIAAILGSADDYDERRVVLVGTWSRGEERSALDDHAWLSGCPHPPDEPEGAYQQRVKVEGWVFSRRHGLAGFGHTNDYRLHVEADRCEIVP